MFKMITAAAGAVALALPAVASAQFATGDVAPWSDPLGYSNRGQCQSFLVQFGNDLRQNPEMRDPENRELSGGEWNRLYRSHWSCTRGEDGRYYITWQL